MAKLSAWIITIIGVLLVLPLLGLTVVPANIKDWLIALGVLVWGIAKLKRNYKL